MIEAHIESLQKALQQDKLDGWLFYSFRGSDPIAENILRLDHAKFTTRRWFYFIPARGTPQKIVHAIETGTLDTLPGDKHVYLPWQQLHEYLREVLRGVKRVAMQYSPMWRPSISSATRLIASNAVDRQALSCAAVFTTKRRLTALWLVPRV